MQLLPREQEKMMDYLAAQIALDRKERGLKLNYPEAVAFIAAAPLPLALCDRGAAQGEGGFYGKPGAPRG